MKIKIEMEIEASPKEVRDTLGLPDIQGVQERIIARVEKKVLDVATDYDPTKLLSIFMPEGFRLSDGVQKMILDKIPKMMKGAAKKDAS